METILTIRDLGARYRLEDGTWLDVLSHVDLDVARGEFVSLVGPSGCGKTTLLHVLAGLMEPSAGRVERAPSARIGVMFQKPTLIPWRTILGNVRFGAECAGIQVSEDVAREILEGMQLSDVLEKRPHQLSEGMKQRVNLARALLVEPDLLLLDEPFSALDVTTRRALQRDLERAWLARKMSVVHVSHNMEDVAVLADRALILSGAPSQIAREERIDTARPRARGPELWEVIQRLEEAQESTGSS